MINEYSTRHTMILVLMCVIIKILEYSSGTIVGAQLLGQHLTTHRKPKKRRMLSLKAGVIGLARGMMTEERLSTLHSPESDCNSNNLDSTASFLSNASSQDIDFIQDHSDYQWFLDYGYRDTQHRSILSLSASYEEGCYDDLARDLDSQLAQVDMEDFRAEDILNTLPAICCQKPQERIGQCESMCKSGPLFSPERESPVCLVDTNYSVDSLDCDEQDILLTCQANKDNYTIAFEGSTIMGEDSDSHDTGDSNTSATWSSDETQQSVALQSHMAISDAPRTTWCKVVTQNNHLYGNMRYSSASLPNLTQAKNQLNHSVVNQHSLAFGGCVKLYDVTHSSSVSGSDNSLSSEQHSSRFSLVRLFIKQRGSVMAHSDFTLSQSTGLCNNQLNENLLTSVRNKNQLHEWVTGATVHSFADSLIEKGVETYSESIERLSESVSVCSCEESLNISRKISCNNNNNNSMDKEQISAPEYRFGERHDSLTRSSIGSSSTSDPTNVTHVPNHIHYSETRCPVHCVDVSMQTSATISVKPQGIGKDDAIPKQSVYVMYPNYTLPDLKFLQEDCLDFEQIFLTPIQFSPSNSPLSSPSSAIPTDIPLHKRQRPYSCADIDHLCKGGFSHVQDWESLAFLLPSEYCMILAGIPELKNYKDIFSNTKPVFYGSTRSNTTKFELFTDGHTNVNNSSSSSTATQPSSGYRGSSTLLTDSSANFNPALHTNGLQNPLFVYRYVSNSSESGYSGPPLSKRSISLPEENSSAPPPRPPLPRSILRNSLENTKLHKNQTNKQRHSTGMFDIQTTNINEEAYTNVKINDDLEKRLKFKNSLCEISQNSEYDEGFGAEIWRPPTPPTTHAIRLQQLLEMSGDQWDPEDMDVLRQQISHFLSQGRTKSVSFADKEEDTVLTPPNSPQASATLKLNHPVKSGTALNDTTINEDVGVSFSQERLTHSLKSVLVDAVAIATTKITSQIQNTGPISSDQVSNAALGSLCPSLYSLLSDGLKTTLETPFGQINNSVWRVVEASAQQGPMTKALNELVLKLNSEEVLTEGVVKFNAFIFGLLNVQGLDVWFSYLRTRESVLCRHYSPNALILCACRGQPDARILSDKLLTSLKPLAQYSFKLDLLYESRLLHQSFLQLSRLPSSPSHSSSSIFSRNLWTLRGLVDSPPPDNLRPRSCIDLVPRSSITDLAATAHKRWSGVNIGGKLSQAFDILTDDTEEDYTDSLETGLEMGTDTGVGSENSGKFRRLQMKWEMLSGKENPSQENSPNCSPNKSSNSAVVHRSRIPRPVTSPSRPTTTLQNIKPSLSKTLTYTNQLRRPSVIPTRTRFPDGPIKARTSRVDAPSKTGPFPRPSSLPYRPQRAPVNHRRAASSSTIRQATHQSHPPNKFVVTLSHRLPSDSGHLAYNEGERLRLVLEVDDTWLLCCRGEAKGLVPRSAVIPLPNKI